MSKIKYFVAVLATYSLCLGMASASIVNYQYTGTVTAGSLAATGSQITGDFSYDTSAPPSSPVPFLATYQFGAPFNISANVAGHAASSNLQGITIFNDYGGNTEDMINLDGYGLTIDGINYGNGSQGFSGLAIRLASKPGNTSALANTDLPSFINLASFDAWAEGAIMDNGTTLLQYSINSISMASLVPEPPVFLLMLLGLLIMSGVMRKDHKLI